jgi:hypothetical protein
MPPPPRSTHTHLAFFLCALAAAVALVITACESTPAVPDLPDLVYTDHLTVDRPAAPSPPSRQPAPIPAKPQQSPFGDIMPRASWTRSPLHLRNAPPMNGPLKITVHHSGDGKAFYGETPADVAAHLRLVQQAHLQRGMDDIAYHFAIDRAGRVWQLRWLAYEGQHVRISKNGTRNNEHNIGIVLLGDFNLQDPTPAQESRLLQLVADLRTMYTPAPRRPLPVAFHGELVDTDCPGKRLLPWLQAARKRGAL